MVHGVTKYHCGHLRFACPCAKHHADLKQTLNETCPDCGGPPDVVREPPPWSLPSWPADKPIPARGRKDLP